MVTLGDKHALPLACYNDRTFQGWVRAQQGDLAGGLASVEQGVSSLRALGHTMYTTYRLTLLAKLHVQAGEFDAAAAVLEEAQSISEQFHERFWDAEVHRLQGELRLAQDAHPLEVERCYLRALKIARTQQA
jgi:predicted ATPase